MREDPESEWAQLGAKSRVRAHEPERFVFAHILPLLFRRTRGREGPDAVFESEDAFWKRSSQLALSSVALNGFRVTDWFPRTPGVYWSDRGVQARRYIFNHQTRDDPELGRIFNPESKMGLIERGGVGTIRLRPRRIDDSDCWLASAVTGPQCAGGVPLAIPDTLVRSEKISWGDTVNLVGQVRFLQDVPSLSDIGSAVHHAPPVLVFVEKIERLKKSQQSTNPIVLTPVVLFTGKDRKAGGSVGYGAQPQYTFVQVDAAHDVDLDHAGEWVALYAEKHGGRVITNFDERRQILADAPLSYQRLVKKTYERVLIENIESVYFNGSQLADRIDNVEKTMSVNVTLGDGTVVHGPLVIANSIENSFNRAAKAPGDEQLRKTLQDLAAQVGKLIAQLDPESAKQAADDLETLTKEATRAKPRKNVWQVSLDGLTEAAKKVRDLGKPILESVAVLAPLLSLASSS